MSHTRRDFLQRVALASVMLGLPLRAIAELPDDGIGMPDFKVVEPADVLAHPAARELVIGQPMMTVNGVFRGVGTPNADGHTYSWPDVAIEKGDVVMIDYLADIGVNVTFEPTPDEVVWPPPMHATGKLEIFSVPPELA